MQLERLVGCARLADDLEVLLGPQQVADAPADQFVVIEKEHPCHPYLLSKWGAVPRDQSPDLYRPSILPVSVAGRGAIRAVLYDFGGVFTRSPFAAVDEGSDELGLDATPCSRSSSAPTATTPTTRGTASNGAR